MIGILIYSPKTTATTTLLASSAETHQKIRLMLRDAKQRGEEWIFFKIKDPGSISKLVLEEEPCKKRFPRATAVGVLQSRAYLRHSSNANCLSFTTFPSWASGGHEHLVRLVRCLTEKDLEELEHLGKKEMSRSLLCCLPFLAGGFTRQKFAHTVLLLTPCMLGTQGHHFTLGISFSPLLMLSNHEIQFWNSHPFVWELRKSLQRARTRGSLSSLNAARKWTKPVTLQFSFRVGGNCISLLFPNAKLSLSSSSSSKSNIEIWFPMENCRSTPLSKERIKKPWTKKGFFWDARHA